jgi:hypothetical protein
MLYFIFRNAYIAKLKVLLLKLTLLFNQTIKANLRNISFRRLYIDILINIIFPILFGIFIYSRSLQVKFIKNQVPDGLWAYSFCSSMLIVWKRRIVWCWIICVFASFFLFEWLQHTRIISGTGDIFDVLVYISTSIFALILNKYFSIIFKNNSYGIKK